MRMLVTFAVIGTLAIIAERLWPARRQKILRRGLLTDGMYVALNIGLRIVFTSTLAVAFSRLATAVFPEWVPRAMLADHPLWIQSIAVIVTLDFFFYWMHRAKHRWDWWWRLHETHHSSEDLDWFSSVRFHPLEKILDRTIYLLPLLFLGVTDDALYVLACVDAFIASFSHANIRLRIGPLIYIVVGPEMHRWHHARTPDGEYCNFGNNLSVFDWIFGTARVFDEPPTDFGIQDRRFPEGNIVRQFFFAFRSYEKPTDGGG